MMREKGSSTARKWISLGLLLVAVAELLPHIASRRLPGDWLDGLCGMLAGVGIAIELLALRQLARARRGISGECRATGAPGR